MITRHNVNMLQCEHEPCFVVNMWYVKSNKRPCELVICVNNKWTSVSDHRYALIIWFHVLVEEFALIYILWALKKEVINVFFLKFIFNL